jgi:hypothetical protein
MIFKQIDDKSQDIKTLKRLLEESKSISQRKLIDIQLKKIMAGYQAEEKNAYYLNFGLKESKNIILLHDIRLEHNGRIAQIDHLLISRKGIELLETKSLKGNVTINSDGSLTSRNGRYTNTYANPLEQSKRHALVIKDFLSDSGLLPKRVDAFGGIDISSKVLIHSNTNLTNNELPDGFERADSFLSKRNKEIDNTSLFKAVGMFIKAYNIDTAERIGTLLVNSHMPIEYDYTKKFKIKKESIEKSTVTIDENPDKNIILGNKKRVCPRCNDGELVIKNGKSKKSQEKYATSEFIGCCRYPKCRYTESA